MLTLVNTGLITFHALVIVNQLLKNIKKKRIKFLSLLIWMIQKDFLIINFKNSLVRVLKKSLIRLKNYRKNIFTKVYLSSKKPTKFPKLLFDLIMDQLFLVLQHQKGSHTLFLQGLLQYLRLLF